LSIDGINGIEISGESLKKVENKNTDATTIGIGIVNTT
jgi:hypothetical protein